MTSPTQRSLQLLREQGWTPWVVERWVPGARIRIDLWNFADLIAQAPGRQPLLVQTTTGGNLPARVQKILENLHARVWIGNGGEIVAHGWRRLASDKSGRKWPWSARTVRFGLDDDGELVAKEDRDERTDTD